MQFPAPVQPTTGEFVALGPGTVLATGDLDRDGQLDVVTVESTDSPMTVRMGDEGRTLGPALTYRDAGPALALAVEDVNGDEWPDVVSARAVGFDSTLDVWLNQGDGSLVRASQIPVCNNPNQLQMGDLDGDGHLDVVLACSADLGGTGEGGGVMTLLGDGEGGFTAQPLLKAGLLISTITLGDFDGDGHLDAAAASLYGQSVIVFLNDGTGRLVLRDILLVSGPPFGVTAGDVDGDGRVDLVVGLPMSERVLILRGNGDGTFDEHRSTRISGAGWVVLVDIDRDGSQDVVVGGYTQPWFHVWRGVDQPHESIVGFDTGHYFNFVEVTDFDGDGLHDILIPGVGIHFQSSCE